MPFLLLLTACQSNPANQVSLVMDKAGHSVNVKGLDDISLHGLQQDSLTVQAWQNLLPVCAMPADTDMRNYQQPITGSYQITGNDIVFTPDTPFKSGQTYFARFYRYDKAMSALDLVMRKRAPGKTGYIELIFKY